MGSSCLIKMMISLENIQEFARKFQTDQENVIREYVQHLFLANLYKLMEAENLLFKGGTCLRFVYSSPRFSEDLDFTGRNIYRPGQIDDLFVKALSGVEKTGVRVSPEEAKPTTGGYLGVMHYELFSVTGDINFEVSLRKGSKGRGEVMTVISDIVTPYTVVSLASDRLVTEKMRALLSRKKPRDYYDLYFLLRNPQLNRFVDKKLLKQVLDILNTERVNFRRELSVLLPVSHHMLLKEFKKALQREIMRYL